MIKKLSLIFCFLLLVSFPKPTKAALTIILTLKDDSNQTLRVIVGEGGEYAFVTGVGSGQQGKGMLKREGNTITLDGKAPGHRIKLTGNTRANTGNATLVVYGVGTFEIVDTKKN